MTFLVHLLLNLLFLDADCHICACRWNLSFQETDDTQETTEFMAALCALKIKATKKPSKYVCTKDVETNPHRQFSMFSVL